MFISQSGPPVNFLNYQPCPLLFVLWFGLVYFILCPSGTQDQPMEESYEEVTIKVVEQEWTCLGSQQLPCWTVMEDMPRM